MIYQGIEIRYLNSKKFAEKSVFNIFFWVFLCLFFVSSQKSYAEIPTHQELLKKIDKSVSAVDVNSAKWYPAYHFTADSSDLVGIAALGQYKDKFHLYYLNNVTLDEKEYQVWGHVVSDNLLNWKKQPSSLVPYAYYDKNGIGGGSTIFDNDLVYIFYTGIGTTEPVPDENVEDKEKNKVVVTQNLATSKDGLYFGRSANNPVLKSVTIKGKHEFSDENFANPYVWKVDETFYALVGAQYKKTKDGAVLLYKSKDLRNWEVVNVSALGQNGEAGYMWESPALFSIDGADVLTIAPKGIKPHGKLFLNKNQSGAFVGKLDYNTGIFTQKGVFMLYDYGFDFYAPKFVKTADGRVICIGYLGMEGTPKTEKSEKWSGMLSIPREVKIVDGKLHTVPAKEIEGLRGDKHTVHPMHFSGEKEVLNTKTPVYELDTTLDISNAKSFAIKLKYDVSNQIVLSYDKDTQVLKLDRTHAGGDLNGEREVVLPSKENKLDIRVFSDKSSVEIFANNGAVAMSTRVYPEKNNVTVKFLSDGETKVEKLDFYKLKSVE